MTHIIFAPTRNRATMYAAGLGLVASDWKHASTPAQEGYRGHHHILPGSPREAVEVSLRNVAKSKGAQLFDFSEF